MRLQKTTTRCVAVTSNASIFTESLEESQRRPGAEMSIGFSGTGEMQTEPAPGSADGAGLTRITTDRITMLILKAVLSAGLYAWF